MDGIADCLRIVIQIDQILENFPVRVFFLYGKHDRKACVIYARVDQSGPWIELARCHNEMRVSNRNIDVGCDPGQLRTLDLRKGQVARIVDDVGNASFEPDALAQIDQSR